MFVPASIAGLPAPNACVNVSPPLFCKGPSNGLVPGRSPGCVSPQVLPCSRLWPREVTAPEQLALPGTIGSVLALTMTFLRVIVAGTKLMMPPPEKLAVLPVTVTLVRAAVALLKMPPPETVAALPLTVTLVSVAVAPRPPVKIPPAFVSALLPLTVTPVSVAAPLL